MKTIGLLVLGFMLHMLYLDAILIHQMNILSKCPEQDKDNRCLKYSNTTTERFYLKYFGLYRLIKYPKIVNGHWRME